MNVLAAKQRTAVVKPPVSVPSVVSVPAQVEEKKAPVKTPVVNKKLLTITEEIPVKNKKKKK